MLLPDPIFYDIGMAKGKINDSNRKDQVPKSTTY